MKSFACFLNEAAWRNLSSTAPKPWELTKAEFNKLTIRHPIALAAGDAAHDYVELVLKKVFGRASESNPVRYTGPSVLDTSLTGKMKGGKDETWVVAGLNPGNPYRPIEIMAMERDGKTYSRNEIDQARASLNLMYTMDLVFPSNSFNAHKNAVRYAVLTGKKVPADVMAEFKDDLKILEKFK